MPDYKTRFILNPTKIVWFRLFLCVRETQRKRIIEIESIQGVCVLYYIKCLYKMGECAQCGKHGVHFS